MEDNKEKRERVWLGDRDGVIREVDIYTYPNGKKVGRIYPTFGDRILYLSPEEMDAIAKAWLVKRGWICKSGETAGVFAKPIPFDRLTKYYPEVNDPHHEDEGR